MRELIDAAGLPERAARRAHDSFRLLAEAEARMHDSEPELVHFHEVGGLDALADVCGVALALEELGIDRVECSPIPCSRGFVDASHGRLPLPAPATLELLRGAPLVPLDLGVELVTPTAAALFAATVERYGALPPMILESDGLRRGCSRHAAGAEHRARPRRRAERACTAGGGEVVVIETNLDDTPGELVPDAAERAFAAGALDVWTTPVQMKKGRPGRRARSAGAAGRRPRGGRGDRARDDRAGRAHVAPSSGSSWSAASATSRSTATACASSSACSTARSSISPPSTTIARARPPRSGDPVKSVWAAALAAAEADA